jgi:hypothetical protein
MLDNQGCRQHTTRKCNTYSNVFSTATMATESAAKLRSYVLFVLRTAQPVSLQSLTAKIRYRTRVSPCRICCGQGNKGAHSSPSTSVVPCPYHSFNAPPHFHFRSYSQQKVERANPASLATQAIELFRQHGRKIIMLLSIHGVTAVSVTS